MSYNAVKELQELLTVISYMVIAEVAPFQKKISLIRGSGMAEAFLKENTDIMMIPARLPKAAVSMLEELLNSAPTVSPERHREILSQLFGTIFIQGANTQMRSCFGAVMDLIDPHLQEPLHRSEH